MDGQNFQNGNEQGNENIQGSYVSNPVYQNSNPTQYSDPIYSNGATYNNESSNIYNNNSAAAEEQKTPGASVAGLVLGIVGILLDCCCGVGTLFGIIGLILGIVGNKNRKTGVGTAAIVCSAVALVIGVLTLIYFFVVGGLAYMEEIM